MALLAEGIVSHFFLAYVDGCLGEELPLRRNLV